MPGQGKGDETAKGEAIPVLACKSGASITGTQPSLDFVGKMKTFHTSIDIPGTTAMVKFDLLGLSSTQEGCGICHHASGFMPSWGPTHEMIHLTQWSTSLQHRTCLALCASHQCCRA